MDPELEFETLKYVTGPLYTEHRDAWLARTPKAREVLHRYEQRRDWRTKVTAKILLAWLSHRAECEQLIDQIEHEDREKWRYSVMVNPIRDKYAAKAWSRPELHVWLRPLSWEAVLKRRDEWSYDTREVFFAMLQHMADDLTIEMAFHLISDIANERRERRFGNGLVGLVPAAVIRPRLAQWRRAEEEVFERLRDASDPPFAFDPTYAPQP